MARTRTFGPLRPAGKGRRIFRFLSRLVLWFLIGSIGLTLLYRFVPVPLTFTMLVDPHGFEKQWVPLSRIDRTMVWAVIASEDGNFCKHNGFDTVAIQKAMEDNADGRRIRGGSTISQQTAKNVFLWQGTGWSRYIRKGFEVWFTLLIETLWDKRRIMEVYLNVAETGKGTYGVEAAARRYFRHSAAQLTQVESARIAAALPNPKRRPVVAPKGFTRRHGNVIARRSVQVRQAALDSCIYK